MTIKFDPAVEIDLGENPRRIVFKSVEEARNWIDAESAAWSEYYRNPPKSLGAFYPQILIEQQQALNEVKGAVVTFEGTEGTKAEPAKIQNALQKFKNARALHSESAIGEKAFQIMADAETLPQQQRAIGFLAAAIGFDKLTFSFGRNNWADNLIPLLEGVALYHDFIGPGEDKTILTDEAIKSTYAGWQQQLANHLNDHFDAVEEIKEAKAAIDAEQTRQKQEFDDRNQKFNERVDELEKFYHDKLKTEAPATYWRDKARNHAWTGRITIAVFFILSGIFAVIAYNLADQLAGSISLMMVPTEEPSELTTNPGVFQLAFTRILVFLVPGFFAVWLLRVLLKVGLSNLAIADDARHRVTLVDTFRSMMEHGEGRQQLDESDRILMLQALFRPTPGSNDDDVGPPNWFDVMMDQVKKRNK